MAYRLTLTDHGRGGSRSGCAQIHGRRWWGGGHAGIDGFDVLEQPDRFISRRRIVICFGRMPASVEQRHGTTAYSSSGLPGLAHRARCRPPRNRSNLFVAGGSPGSRAHHLAHPYQRCNASPVTAPASTEQNLPWRPRPRAGSIWPTRYERWRPHWAVPQGDPLMTRQWRPGHATSGPVWECASGSTYSAAGTGGIVLAVGFGDVGRTGTEHTHPAPEAPRRCCPASTDHRRRLCSGC